MYQNKPSTYHVQEVNGSDSLGIPAKLAQNDQFHAQDFRHRTAALTFPHKIQCDRDRLWNYRGTEHNLTLVTLFLDWSGFVACVFVSAQHNSAQYKIVILSFATHYMTS